MKVILSVEPIRFPLTGIGRYTWELASALQQTSAIDHLTFFSGRRFISELPTAQESAAKSHSLKRWVQSSHLASEAYRLLMPFLRKQVLKGHEDFLYHGPNFFLPPFAGKKVATFHDLSPFTWSQCNTSQRIRFIQKECLNTLATADALITDSLYNRQELADYFNWPIERIFAVPLACSADFQPRSSALCQVVLQRYNLSYQGYSLYVGTIEPRKNLSVLLDAYSRLPLATRRRYPLILTGYQGWQNELIMEKINLAQQQGWARYLGFLPAADLPILFSGAKAFCFPSLYEGFGLPVLEAMASGVPVVCSHSSSLPEVVGEAGLMCDPQDTVKFSELLLTSLEDDIWRSQAIINGLLQSQQFSWQRCAAQTLAVYQKVLKS
ncbi:glycosyltransferase family 4 protein [Aeromonas veronii]|uniref:glycosyltransferase family 4 protein n=1 Tax=Aeromonas veronii TaxID=654 RepID=UPI003D20CA52